MGQAVSGFRLVTTAKLVKEAQSPELQEKYPLLADLQIQKELKAAALKFPTAVQDSLKEETEEFRVQANAVVERHCAQQKIKIRSLSSVDASLWATAVHMKGALATDEWPLTMAAESIPFDDDGNCLQVFSSVHLLHMLESGGKLDADGRWNMMRQWRQEDEHLHRDADKHYETLFGEKPPNAQSTAK